MPGALVTAVQASWEILRPVFCGGDTNLLERTSTQCEFQGIDYDLVCCISPTEPPSMYLFH